MRVIAIFAKCVKGKNKQRYFYENLLTYTVESYSKNDYNDA